MAATRDSEQGAEAARADVARAEAMFTEPNQAETMVEIDEFNPNGNHWIAIANVTGHDKTWNRALELREKTISGDSAARSELSKLVDDWSIDKFWIKNYVPKSPFKVHVSDGGTNPLQGLEPQAMVLLLLKVDDVTHRYFSDWMKGGAYEGIPVSKLGTGMILARREIFFP